MVDLGRIISALTFSPDGNIAIKPKGVIAIEHFLVLRNIMYRTIYNHRINEISTWILEKIFYVIKNNNFKKVWIDKSFQKFIFSTKSIDIDDFIKNASIDGEKDFTDGLRASFENGWALLRASNTTPKLVLRFEADSQESLEKVQNNFLEELKKFLPNEDINLE